MWVCSQPEAKQGGFICTSSELGSDHQPQLAGCSFRLMLQGKVQVMTAAATKAARFLLNQKLFFLAPD